MGSNPTVGTMISSHINISRETITGWNLPTRITKPSPPANSSFYSSVFNTSVTHNANRRRIRDNMRLYFINNTVSSFISRQILSVSRALKSDSELDASIGQLDRPRVS